MYISSLDSRKMQLNVASSKRTTCHSEQKLINISYLSEAAEVVDSVLSAGLDMLSMKKHRLSVTNVLNAGFSFLNI